MNINTDQIRLKRLTHGTIQTVGLQQGEPAIVQDLSVNPEKYKLYVGTNGTPNGNKEVGAGANVLNPIILVDKGKLASANDILQCIFSDLTFAIIRNSNNNYASLSVKSTDGSDILILYSWQQFYGAGGVQAGNNNATANNTWTVLDNDLGYERGGSHIALVMNKDTLDVYYINVMIGNSGVNDRADYGYISVQKNQ